MANVSTWTGRVGRLISMRRHELFVRLRQHVTARIDMLRCWSGQDFAGDTQIEPAVRNGRFFFTPEELAPLCVLLKQVFPATADDIVFRGEKICQHRFDLLGYENLDYGAEIDWHFDMVHGKHGPRKPWFKIKYLDFQEVGDSKITWELNRHQHLVTLAKAYWLTGDDKFVREIFSQWTHWHQENPYPIGINWASSLEVAYRSLSWVWTFFLLQNCPLFTREMRSQWLHAMSVNGRHVETYLSTYFSPNTHLLGEALALFVLGTLFPSQRSARRWQRHGWEILEREAMKQVREDGFYFEQSTYYHVYAADIFLHARILAALNRVAISAEFDEILQRMLNALLLLSRTGIPPNVGDDDGGRLFDPSRNRAEHLVDPLATGAVLYSRGDFKFVAGGPREETLWLLGTKGLAAFECLRSAQPSGASVSLPASGFYLMADAELGEQLLIDAGPLGSGTGGHGHADALSICLIRNGRNFLMDSGTFEYVGDSSERARLRGTGAHNTLQVDGRDQADAIGPFSWKNQPTVKVERWITGRQFDLFQGSHDGYSRLPSAVIHRRWVFHKKGGLSLVRDLAAGRGRHQLDITWHIGTTLSPASSRHLLFASDEESLALLTAEDHYWSQSIRRDYWSPAYGQKERATVVNFGAVAELPADFATVIIGKASSRADLGQFVKLSAADGSAVSAYRYCVGHQDHNFVFADQPGSWVSGHWASDADFVYWFLDREREQYTLVLCNGSYVDAGGRRVVSCGRRVSYAEVVSSGMKVDLFSSDPEHVLLQQSLDRVWAGGDLMVPGKDPTEVGG